MKMFYHALKDLQICLCVQSKTAYITGTSVFGSGGGGTLAVPTQWKKI